MTTQHGGGPEARPATWEDGSVAADYDALADLFLSDESLAVGATEVGAFEFAAPAEPAESAARPAGPARSEAAAEEASERRAAPAHGARTPAVRHFVEALLFGHMPPMAGAWAAQFAAKTAKDSGEPVAFVRLHAGHTTVQVFGAPANTTPTESDDFAEAVRIAAGIANRIIVRVDETDEPSLVRWDALNAVTLLAGADQAAVVAAYRTIKQIAGALDDARSGVALRVSFTGVDDDKARGAFEKLERAAAAFLETPLTRLPGVSRMAPSIGLTLHRAETPLDAQQALGIVAGALGAPKSMRARASKHAATVVSAHAVAAQDDAPDCAALDAPDDAGERAHAERIKARERDRSEGGVTATARAVDAQDSLAARLDALTPTPFRCPHAPDVEVAVGEDGALHLLVDQRARGAVKSLLCARAWAAANMALLVAACRGERTPGARADRPLALHVFVREAKRARALLDTDVRVHLLMRVRVDGREAWACADLN